MKTTPFPQLHIDLNKILSNTQTIVEMCSVHDIRVTGVIKGCAGMPEVAEQMVKGGCTEIASSRLEQLERCREHGINAPLMMLRIPMISEVDNLVQVADISLNSEKETLITINQACKKYGKTHKVILMYDVGDLREGVCEVTKLVDLALFTEYDLPHITLWGIGTNMTCYGAIRPTTSNTQELCDVAASVEKAIGRKLDIVSAGTTTSLPLVLSGDIPEKVNNLRIGAAILTPNELVKFWNCNIPGINISPFTLAAEIIEINSKPTYPIGDIFIDAYGDEPCYVDKGIRKRAILAVGNADLGNCYKLLPLDKQCAILGASSDHLIVDIELCQTEYKLGGIMEFELLYQPLLFLSNNASVQKAFV